MLAGVLYSKNQSCTEIVNFPYQEKRGSSERPPLLIGEEVLSDILRVGLPVGIRKGPTRDLNMNATPLRLGMSCPKLSILSMRMALVTGVLVTLTACPVGPAMTGVEVDAGSVQADADAVGPFADGGLPDTTGGADIGIHLDAAADGGAFDTDAAEADAGEFGDSGAHADAAEPGDSGVQDDAAEPADSGAHPDAAAPDANALDATALDAEPSDTGTPDTGANVCSSNADCPYGQECLGGRCFAANGPGTLGVDHRRHRGNLEHGDGILRDIVWNRFYLGSPGSRWVEVPLDASPCLCLLV